ncbi:UNVERIFIED_CONTAM: hypothetical protein NCL1_43174 [Trichonephila clavipes]
MRSRAHSNRTLLETVSVLPELMVVWSRDDFHAAFDKQFVRISLFLMTLQLLKKVNGTNLPNNNELADTENGPRGRL